MRFFTHTSPAVRLPALPRRLSLMAASLVLVIGLVLSPFLINEVARADSHGTHFKITIPHDAKNAPRDQVLEASPLLDAPAAEG